MDRWLKLLIAAACLVVIAAGVSYGWSEYNRSLVLKAQQAEVERTLSNRRAQELAAQGCRPQIEELLNKHASHPITSATDVPAPLREDVTLCVRRKLAYAFEQNELSRTGLDKLFR